MYSGNMTQSCWGQKKSERNKKKRKETRKKLFLKIDVFEELFWRKIQNMYKHVAKKYVQSFNGKGNQR